MMSILDGEDIHSPHLHTHMGTRMDKYIYTHKRMQIDTHKDR